MGNRVSIPIGTRYGRWTVLCDAPDRLFSGINKRMVRCKCDCGIEREITPSVLNYGASKSCGCLTRDMAKEVHTEHGLSKTRSYRIWWGMIDRCCNEKSKDYRKYGMCGITVSNEWRTFENFYRDMGEPPNRHLTLDRRNNDIGYSKENCRWATKIEQGNNRSDNVLITFQEKTQTIAQWARETGIHPDTIGQRVRRGWTNDKLFLHPDRGRRIVT